MKLWTELARATECRETTVCFRGSRRDVQDITGGHTCQRCAKRFVTCRSRRRDVGEADKRFSFAETRAIETTRVVEELNAIVASR